MKQYESYKASDIPWASSIPSHWEVKRLRFICGYQKGKNPESLYFDYEDNMLPYLSMEYIRESSEVIQYAHPTHSSILCDNGDIILLWDGSNAGEFLKSKSGILCSTCAVISTKGANQDYFWYWCKTVQQYLKDMTNGMGVPHVDAEILKNLKVNLPPISEQNTIVAYLDKKCVSIDKVIATQEQRIALLGELKQSIITETVTRGLNPDVKVKHSGVDWIGNIPEHWQIMPFKFCMSINNGSDYKHIESDESNGFPVLGSGGIFAYASEYMYEGEALLLGRKGTIDKPLYFNGRFWTVDTMFYAIPKQNAFCKYMYYQALGFPFGRYSTSTALPSMTSRDLNNNPICLPPFEEQKSIVEAIETKIRPVESAIAKATREVELLREFKQSVITEAVTGKIKVC